MTPKVVAKNHRMKTITAIPLILLWLTGLVMFAFLVADICASWAGSPWRWLWPVVYALIFRFTVNPFMTGLRRQKRLRSLAERMKESGLLRPECICSEYDIPGHVVGCDEPECEGCVYLCPVHGRGEAGDRP